MAADPINVVPKLHAVQYDGTNSGDIDNLFSLNNSSEVGGVWTFQSPADSAEFIVNTNDWIVYTQNQVVFRIPENEFAPQYSCNVLCTDLEALSAIPSVRAMGAASVPTLLLTQSANVEVTLQPAMPDDEYDAYASKFGAALLGDLTIDSVTVVDEDTVQVGVTNSGVGTITGAVILVHAVA